MLHKMFLQYLKVLVNTLTNRDTRNNYDKLTPTVLLVQFKHGLAINIGFTCTCLHFHIKRAGTKSV